MPIIKSAKKALRQSQKRTKINKQKKQILKQEIKKFRISKDLKSLNLIFSLADKAVKSGILHKNKAKRIKSSLSKVIVSPKINKKVTAKTTKASKRKAKQA